MITEQQKTERKAYLGSSDAASIVGLSRYKTMLECWAEKVGEITPDKKQTLQARLGNKLEETVADLFEEETDKKVQRVNETRFHPKYPFLAANLDRLVIGEGAILECKTTSAWNKDDWKDGEIPPEALIQVYHQLGVTGHKKAYVACLIGNQQFIWKEIIRDEKIISDIITKEVKFWKEYVEPKVMPMVITRNDSDVLFQLFPEGEGGEILQLGDEANILVENIQAMNQDLNNLEGIIETNKNQLKALLKEKEAGKTSKYLVTWKNQTTKRLDTDRIKKEAPEIYTEYAKETASRVLRFKPVKGEK